MLAKRIAWIPCLLLTLTAACDRSSSDDDVHLGAMDTSVDASVDLSIAKDTQTDTDACTPSCAQKECGDDGCDGNCGECSEGEYCEDGWCMSDGGCMPDCGSWKLCGDDGCGGSCGACDDGLECHHTELGIQCTTPCELFTCPEGQLCLFGYCVARECETDEDCGSTPAHYCNEYLQCRKRTTCADTTDCQPGNKEGYCDLTTQLCMYDGHCWDDGDCSAGTCGADHWCEGHNCFVDFGPGCPPHAPICDGFEAEALLCDGVPCSECVLPCVFDVDCTDGEVCSHGKCYAAVNHCDLDSECSKGQYCHSTCKQLRPACDTESDCPGGTHCMVGFCMDDEAIPCQADAECAVLYEGYVCVDGSCEPEGACVLDSQCPEDLHCYSDTCQPLPELPECRDDTDCPPGQICENEACKTPPPCQYDVQCPAGHVCEESQCYNDVGVCAWLEKGLGFCSDGDSCTEDTCDAVSGCVHTPGACG